MKTKTLFLLLTLTSLSLFGQTTEERIRIALDHYTIGTAYNQVDRIAEAFIPGAPLYLDHPEDPMRILSVEEYIGFWDGSTPGQFSGRYTNVLSIDHFGGVAIAKLEVLMPRNQRRFIDYMVLREVEGDWKIVAKTATSEATEKVGKKALLILSSADQQGESDLPAGNSFGEVSTAYDVYTKAGYHVDIVTPLGGAAPLAYINPANELHQTYLYNADFMYALAHTRTPNQVVADEYDIVQFTGGSAPIFDLPEHQAIQELAMHVYEKNNGVIAAVCHGTAALVNLQTQDGDYLVAGKRVNGFPDAHERKDLPHYEQYPFIIEEKLRQRGADFRYEIEKGKAYVEVDGRLVTGQNWESSAAVTQKSIEISQQNQAEE